MIIEIALGIVLAVLILAFLPWILGAGLIVVGVGIAVAIVVGIVMLFGANPELAVIVPVVAIIGTILVLIKVLHEKAEKRFGKTRVEAMYEATVVALIITPMVVVYGVFSVGAFGWPYGYLVLVVLMILLFYVIRRARRSWRQAKRNAVLSGESVSGGS